jgi:hypothetical protein
VDDEAIGASLELLLVGNWVGELVAAVTLGDSLDGTGVGSTLGLSEGVFDGTGVGSTLGLSEGVFDGTGVGSTLGLSDGVFDGAAVDENDDGARVLGEAVDTAIGLVVGSLLVGASVLGAAVDIVGNALGNRDG